MKVIVYPNGVIGLHPEEPNEWIYTEPEPDHREFVPSITTRPDDQPNWHECTTADKQAWEEQHLPEPDPDPADPEPSDDPEQPANVPAEPEPESAES